jgi:hypothetical protein
MSKNIKMTKEKSKYLANLSYFSEIKKLLASFAALIIDGGELHIGGRHCRKL